MAYFYNEYNFSLTFNLCADRGLNHYLEILYTLSGNPIVLQEIVLFKNKSHTLFQQVNCPSVQRAAESEVGVGESY